VADRVTDPPLRLAWQEPYFTDVDGMVWHVYDTAKVDGRRKNVGLGSSDATHRVFIAADRTELVCQLAVTDREISAEQLGRQLKFARSSAAWSGAFQPMRKARR
jgi:hypothetical protein